MLNNNYNKNILEAVTPRLKVSGDPSRVSFRPVKTTLFLFFFLINISFADDLICEVNILVDKFNGESPIKISMIDLDDGYETAKEAEVRIQKEEYEREDVALNKAEIENQVYWVNGKWTYTNYPKPAHSIEELKDSDNDGYDDYTEFVYGSDQFNKSSIPIIRDGNNKIIFKK